MLYRQRLVQSLGIFIAAFSASLGNAATPAPEAFGPWAVGHQSIEVVDASRDDRVLPLDIWYPVDPNAAADEPLAIYPLALGAGVEALIAVDDLPVSLKPRHLIVFSHGNGGTNTQSTPLMENLASHGFIVAAPSHTGNTSTGPQDPPAAVAANRVPDISFIIDTMMAKSGSAQDPFYNRVIPSGVGVVGHSYGGTTTLGTAAGFSGAPADPRVTAIAPISAAAIGVFSAQQLASITQPTLLLGGTDDQLIAIGHNQFAYTHLGKHKPVYDARIIDASHYHFANICSIADALISLGLSPDTWSQIGAGALQKPYDRACSEGAFPLDEAVRLQNLYVTAFFARHLNNDLRYAKFLAPGYSIRSESDIEYQMKLPLLHYWALWQQFLRGR